MVRRTVGRRRVNSLFLFYWRFTSQMKEAMFIGWVPSLIRLYKTLLNLSKLIFFLRRRHSTCLLPPNHWGVLFDFYTESFLSFGCLHWILDWWVGRSAGWVVCPFGSGPHSGLRHTSVLPTKNKDNSYKLDLFNRTSSLSTLVNLVLLYNYFLDTLLFLIHVNKPTTGLQSVGHKFRVHGVDSVDPSTLST